jgi:L-ascorbate metabolism protein UlaG (beta-lactamase superfamily)
MDPWIRPVRTGSELVEEIRATRPVPGSLAVWWLGQSGYLIKSRHGLLVIDPYLSEHLTIKYQTTARPHIRMTIAPLRGAELSQVDAVVSSHKHSDHLDPGTIPDLMAASPAATLYLPESIREFAQALGLPDERIVGISAGQTAERAGFRIRAVPAAHEGLDTDESGRHLYLGFVIEADGVRIYHSGDTMLYHGLVDWLGPGPFDAMFLPINGRDPARGVAGNMSAADAVELATLCRPRYVVPHHYDMFTFNTVPESAFELEAARLPAGVIPRILRCGERWEIET